MNEKQPYEKHLADKLQQLPPPDNIDRHWEQMRKLLDKEMPRGGAYGGPGGRGKRYLWLLLLGVVLLTATWFTGREILTNEPSAPNAATHSATGTSTPSSGEALPGKTPNTNTEGQAPVAGGSTPTAGNEPGTATGPDQPAGTGTTASPIVEPGHEPPTAGASQPAYEKPFQQQKQSLHEAIITQKGDNISNPSRPNRPEKKIDGKVKEGDNITLSNNRKNNFPEDLSPKTAETPRNSTGGNTEGRRTASASDQLLAPSLVLANGMMPGFANPSEGRVMPDHGLSLKVNKPEATPEYIAARARARRIARNRAEKAFAVGLSLPLAFPLGDQKALGYNRNAGANTVSDYLPSPHVQYYFNNRTFLQGEVQAISPQFIRPIMMYQDKYFQSSSNAWIYNTVSAHKLYYFNIPVTIHHSPMKNFYLGTGLQFSSLLSSVALYEEKKVAGGQQVYAKETYARLAGDSLSNRMNNNEVRLLLDVNYYWQRFTVGLRYNQALNNYANFQVANNLPFTYDKNKALQFYLRYNLWEDKKRKQPTKSMLTLK